MPAVLHLLDNQTPNQMLGQLALLGRPGDRIVAVGAPPPGAAETLAVEVVARPLGPALLMSPKLRQLSEGVGLVHAWSPGLAGLAGEIARDSDCGVVLSLGACPATAELRKLQGRTDHCRRVITISSAAARAQMVGRGVPGSLVRTLAPAARQPQDASRRRAAVRRSLGIPDDIPVVIAPDALDKYAGQRVTIWAYGLLRQVLPELRLIMPAAGADEPYARYFARTVGYRNEIIFPGFDFDQSDLLAAADAAVFFHQRQLGTAGLAQAMAAGLAIGATALPNLLELAPSELVSVTTPPADVRGAGGALLRLLEEPALRSRLGDEAARRAERLFDVKLCRARLDEIYETLRS